MPSLPMDNTDGRTTSGVSCYHRPWLADTVRRHCPWKCHHPNWTAQTIGLRRARHDMMSLGQHTWSDDVDHGNVIISLGFHTQSNDVKRGMPSSPLGSTNGQTMSGLTCHHCPWEIPRVRQSKVWHGITSLGQHTRSNYVGRGMPSLPLDNTDGRTTSGVSCYHHPWLAHMGT